jgi:hypothetical protein
VALWSTGVNGVFHHNEAQEHVETSRPAGQAAQSQGKQATNNDRNSNVRHTMNLVSSTDQCSMFRPCLGVLKFYTPVNGTTVIYCAQVNPWNANDFYTPGKKLFGYILKCLQVF